MVDWLNGGRSLRDRCVGIVGSGRRMAAEGRGMALPRPSLVWRARRSLAPTREHCSREAARLARSANPTRGRVKRGTGGREVGRWTDVDGRTDATQSRPYPMQSENGGPGSGTMEAARGRSVTPCPHVTLSTCPLIPRPFVSTWEGGVATNGASLLSPNPLVI